jgi:sec-independent protein translocase protein TatA
MLPSLGYGEMIFFGILALMLFGSRLPEVARSLGGSYRELKRNVANFQREFQELERYEPKPSKPAYTPDEQEPQFTSAPKFSPPSVDSSDRLLPSEERTDHPA